MYEILVYLLSILLLISFFIIYKLYKSSSTYLDLYEENTEYIAEIENILQESFKKIHECKSDLMKIDHMGLFANNDHTGSIFNRINSVVSGLYDFIIKYGYIEDDKNIQEKKE